MPPMASAGCLSIRVSLFRKFLCDIRSASLWTGLRRASEADHAEHYLLPYGGGMISLDILDGTQHKGGCERRQRECNRGQCAKP